MSILNRPTQPQKTEQELKAERLINSTVNLTNLIIMEWGQGIDDLWDDEDPQGILNALGTDGAEIFELSTAIINLMTNILPEKLPEEWEKIQEKLSKIKPVSIDEEGNVTII